MLRARFLAPLRVQQVSEAQGTWMLLAPLRYVSPLYRGLLVVPAGFRTDFASVPRLPFTFWLFGGLGQAAATLHDFLYQTHLTDRAMADAIFDEALAVLGVSAWRRWPMWAALRAAGWVAWRSGPRRYSQLANYHVADRRTRGRPPSPSATAMRRQSPGRTSAPEN